MLKETPSFVDFKSAFDTVWHQGLLYKLKAAGVGTKFYNIIQNMYSKTEVCVKIDNYRTDFFKSKLGVKQGDNLSPNLFNLYVNDLPSYFDASCDPVTINKTQIHYLMYADDVVLLSTTEKGIQSCVDKLSKFAKDWKMTINTNITKMLVFNKGGRLKNTIMVLFNVCKSILILVLFLMHQVVLQPLNMEFIIRAIKLHLNYDKPSGTHFR